MGKIKTHKASQKRFSFTATGKVKMHHAGHRHKLGQKPTKIKRHLRSTDYVSDARMYDIKRMLPYA